MNIDGEVFIPSGSTFGDLDNQIALKADTSYVNTQLGLKANTTDLKEIGVGQTWQNVTASRALNTTYTNSTGKPIVIVATIARDVAGTTTAKGLVNGVEIIRSWASYTTSGNATGIMVTFIVPTGSTYLVDSISSGSLYSWSELR